MKYQTMRRLILPFTKILFPTKVINLENYTNGPKQAIYICNHYTFFDTAPHIAYIFKEKPVSILAKEEVFKNKFFKKFLDATNAIPVKRDGKDSVAIMKTIKILKSGESILIFPEGTRNKKGDKDILPLKDGVVGFSSKFNIPVVSMMYYRPLKPFRKNYLIIGTPLNFSEIQENFGKDFTFEIGNQILKKKMIETRIPMDALIEGKKIKIKKIEASK